MIFISKRKQRSSLSCAAFNMAGPGEKKRGFALPMKHTFGLEGRATAQNSGHSKIILPHFAGSAKMFA